MTRVLEYSQEEKWSLGTRVALGHIPCLKTEKLDDLS